jgi:hypothetical protein
MRAFTRILGAASFAAVALAAPGAGAFCRSTTCADADCPRDAHNCKTTGHPLFWPTSCVGFSIQKDETANLPPSDVRKVIVDSFVSWSSLVCKAGGQADIGFGELDDADCHVAQFNASGPNANVVMFQDDKWSYTDVSDTLAKTTVSYDTSTGEIWDADIELNSAYNQLTVGDDHVVYDLQSLLTHEIGHLIGLDHSLDDAATMNADYMVGSIFQRTLAPDDIAGACAAYAPSRTARCSLTPRGGFVSACTGDAAPPMPGGCEASRSGDGRGGAGGVAFLLAAIAIGALRKRRRPAAMLGALGVALGAAAIASACGKAATETLCDAGSVIFCMCPDGEAGSKTCSADGQSFDDCKLQSTGELCPNHLPTTSSSGGSSAGGGGASSTSNSGGSGGSASGGGGTALIGACPGIPTTVSQANDTTVGGDTSQAADREQDRCGGQGAPEIAYEVTPMSSGTLVVTASGIGQTDPVLYARTGDCESGVSLGCSDATPGGGTEVLTLEAVANTPLWIFVDGAAASSGSFSLNLHLTGGVPGDTCPGVSVAIDPGDVITAGGDTSIASPNYKGTGACSTSGTREIVYAVTPSADGMLTVTLDPAFDAQLYARSGSCTSSTTGTQLGCSDNPGSGTEETIAFAVTGGTTYSVFADGAPNESGPYTISFQLQ